MTLLARIALWTFNAANIAVLLGLAWWGWDYYASAAALRPDHAQYSMLAPGAPIGVLLGLVGTTMMVVMMLYSVRKLLWRVSWFGGVVHWLRFHISCGVFGPIYIIYHGGFTLPTGLIAVGFWCMVVVALSGVFGRYVHGLLPRMAEGTALEREGALARLVDLRADLVQQTATADAENIGLAVHLVRDFDMEANSLMALWRLNQELGSRRRRIRQLLDTAGLESRSARAARSALGEQLKLKRGLEASRLAHRMLRYWHLFHRPLAGAMYVIISVHIGFAILFGGSLARLMELLP